MTLDPPRVLFTESPLWEGRKRGGQLGPEPRLIHLGDRSFREHHQSLERLPRERNVPHVYRDGPKREQPWSNGGLEEAVEALAAGAG